MSKAVEIPLGDAGISIRCGRDGVWLSFATETRKEVMVHVANKLGGNESFTQRVIAEWCSDIQEMRDKILAQEAIDNSQYGVGA